MYRGLMLTAALIFLAMAAPAAAAPDEAGFEVIATMKVGANPHGIKVEGDRLYVAMAGDDAVWVIDRTRMERIARWPVKGAPLDLVRSRDGWLVAAFSSDHLIELGGPDHTPGESWPVGKGPSLFAPRTVNGLAYIVSEFADRLTVFDTRANTITASYQTGDRPYPGDVTSDGVLAFIPNRDEGTVSVIDLLNGEEAARVKDCATPEGGSLSVDGTLYMVTCSADNEVVFINTASFEIVGRVSEGVGPRPFSVVTSADGRWAFANNAGGKTVSVIDMAARAVVDRITVGDMPIVMRNQGDRLYVSNEGSDTLTVIALPAGPVKKPGAAKNEVVVLGMIHGQFLTSKRYSLDFLRALIEDIAADYVLPEIPPNRYRAALAGFVEDGEVTEPRVRRFPEYVKVLFPLTRTMDFEIIPTAGWNEPMSRFRAAALERISKDPARAADWAQYQAAERAMDAAIGDRADDPYFIHSAEYDALTKAGLEPYDRLFNDELGTGGWATINAAHYALIAQALDAHAGEGKRILITYGAGHKYWFLEKLRARGDITLLDPKPFLDHAAAALEHVRR